MHFLLAFVTALLLMNAARADVEQDSNAVQDRINSFCADEWTTDYEMQAYCRDRQTRAAVEFLTFTRDNDGEERDIFIRCYGEWLDESRRPDWEMSVYCGNKQLEAYRSLR